MAQNYNLKSFGLNVIKQGAKTNETQKLIEIDSQNDNLFGPIGNFVDKYENVLVGDVEKEINMYSRQAMIVGMNLKAADSNVRRFDVNI